MEASYYYEDLLNGFSLSDDAEISAGRYRFVDGALTLTTSQGQRLRGRLHAQAGGFFDGSRTSASISPEWSISAKLQLAVTYGYDRVRFPDRDQLFDAHLLRARADLMLSTKLSISFFIQYNSSIDAAIANVRLRINPRQGNDFYFVFNGGFNTDRHAYDPRLPFSSRRTIIAKYTYTFHPKPVTPKKIGVFSDGTEGAHEVQFERLEALQHGRGPHDSANSSVVLRDVVEATQPDFGSFTIPAPPFTWPQQKSPFPKKKRAYLILVPGVGVNPILRLITAYASVVSTREYG